MNVDITIPAQEVTIPSQDVSADIPAAEIVYQNSWLGQTSNLSLSDIFTLPADGQYRVTISLLAESSSGNLSVSASVGFPTSGVSSASWNSASASVNPSTSSVDTAIDGVCKGFVGQNGGQVSLTTNKTGAGTLDHYDVYVTIEQLQ
jgi:hypothetical protein